MTTYINIYIICLSVCLYVCIVSVPDAVLKKLKQVLRQKKLEEGSEEKKGVQEFQIWDFAGQDVYYTTHQVFLSNRALYMVVFDLQADLKKPVRVEVFHNEKVRFGCVREDRYIWSGCFRVQMPT